MKVIFLDIDGVMIKIGDVTEEVRESRAKKPETGLLKWFDKSCVDNLKYIIEQTNAVIVISSSWRHRMEDVKESFIDADIDWNLVISRTPSGLDHGRGNEILSWLQDYHRTCKNGWHISHWIAIDDDSFDMKSINRLGQFVHTNHTVGITEENMKLAIELLNK